MEHQRPHERSAPILLRHPLMHPTVLAWWGEEEQGRSTLLEFTIHFIHLLSPPASLPDPALTRTHARRSKNGAISTHGLRRGMQNKGCINHRSMSSMDGIAVMSVMGDFDRILWHGRVVGRREKVGDVSGGSFCGGVARGAGGRAKTGHTVAIAGRTVGQRHAAVTYSRFGHPAARQNAVEQAGEGNGKSATSLPLPTKF